MVRSHAVDCQILIAENPASVRHWARLDLSKNVQISRSLIQVSGAATR